jgi:hypothetical protein
MMSRLLTLPLLAAVTIGAAPPKPDGEGLVLAERRLRACLEAHASPRHGALDAAIAAARTACRPQIENLRDVRILEATAGLEHAEAEIVERRVTRKLNNEIAFAVASHTGLPAPDAHD